MPIYPEEKSSKNVKEFRIHCKSIKLLLTLTMVAIHSGDSYGVSSGASG